MNKLLSNQALQRTAKRRRWVNHQNKLFKMADLPGTKRVYGMNHIFNNYLWPIQRYAENNTRNGVTTDTCFCFSKTKLIRNPSELQYILQIKTFRCLTFVTVMFKAMKAGILKGRKNESPLWCRGWRYIYRLGNQKPDGVVEIEGADTTSENKYW